MFECHITCDRRDAEAAQRVADIQHWSTSEIARDPVLGKDSYFYLTGHGTHLPGVQARMELAVHELKRLGVRVLREKIEVIIYDSRYV